MSTLSKEKVVSVASGWVMLPVVILFALASFGTIVLSGMFDFYVGIPVGIVGFISSVILMAGFFTLQPNEARVLILFGDYKGTVRTEGFHWANPFYSRGLDVSGFTASTSGESLSVGTVGQKTKISLRARNFNGEKLKVNDRRGNPVEIAAVVVWHVEDTAMAVFDVDDYENYVEIQSETALRHVASVYAYDHGSDEDTDDNEITLRGNIEEVSEALKAELTERLSRAGVVIDDSRLTHLAYAPEIAQAMLRRQQAEAIIAARRKIVTGAVSMVEMALSDLAERNVVNLDDERKAAMVSNLMVVLCGESEVHPVVNAGSLY